MLVVLAMLGVPVDDDAEEDEEEDKDGLRRRRVLTRVAALAAAAARAAGGQETDQTSQQRYIERALIFTILVVKPTVKNITDKRRKTMPIELI